MSIINVPIKKDEWKCVKGIEKIMSESNTKISPSKNISNIKNPINIKINVNMYGKHIAEIRQRIAYVSLVNCININL